MQGDGSQARSQPTIKITKRTKVGTVKWGRKLDRTAANVTRGEVGRADGLVR